MTLCSGPRATFRCCAEPCGPGASERVRFKALHDRCVETGNRATEAPGALEARGGQGGLAPASVVLPIGRHPRRAHDRLLPRPTPAALDPLEDVRVVGERPAQPRGCWPM